MVSALSHGSIGGLALLGAVPYYMADTAYPAASSALLTSLAKFADGEHEVEERGEQAVEVLEEVNHSDENFLEISGWV